MQYTSVIIKIPRSADLSVVHFAADWVEQCGQVNEVLDALSTRSEYAQIKFYNCQAEDLSDLSLNYKIEAVPTVLLFKSNKEIDRINGADPAKITEKIKQHSTPNTEKSHQSLDDRLKGLVNKAPVMLFMKGNRETPRCGFSRQIIEILNGTG